MLTRKCQETTGLLITEEDFNVRITFAKNANLNGRFGRFTQKSYVEGAWKEYMRDSMGEVLNRSTEYFVECTIVKAGEVKKLSEKLLSNQIINHFWQDIEDADGVRFTATNAIGKNLSWIFVRE